MVQAEIREITIFHEHNIRYLIRRSVGPNKRQEGSHLIPSAWSLVLQVPVLMFIPPPNYVHILYRYPGPLAAQDVNCHHT